MERGIERSVYNVSSIRYVGGKMWGSAYKSKDEEVMKFRSVADEELVTRDSGPYSFIVFPNRNTSSISPAVWWELKSPVDSVIGVFMCWICGLSASSSNVERNHIVFKSIRTQILSQLGYDRAQGLNFIGYLNPVNPRDTEKTWEKLDEYRISFAKWTHTLMMLSMKLKNPWPIRWPITSKVMRQHTRNMQVMFMRRKLLLVKTMMMRICRWVIKRKSPVTTRISTVSHRILCCHSEELSSTRNALLSIVTEPPEVIIGSNTSLLLTPMIETIVTSSAKCEISQRNFV